MLAEPRTGPTLLCISQLRAEDQLPLLSPSGRVYDYSRGGRDAHSDLMKPYKLVGIDQSVNYKTNWHLPGKENLFPIVAEAFETNTLLWPATGNSLPFLYGGGGGEILSNVGNCFYFSMSVLKIMAYFFQ